MSLIQAILSMLFVGVANQLLFGGGKKKLV